jgi:hypothetical protein
MFAPSRHDNPFATCWTRPGALPFRFRDGQSADQLVARLAAQGWQGAIVGPHGSGKTSLLETLKPALRAAGCTFTTISLRNGQRRLPKLNVKFNADRSLLIVDGYEQLGWIERARLKRRCRRAKIGLLVTAHAPTNIATLIRLAPDRMLIEQLVAQLSARTSTPITAADVAASYACHESNVREIFFDLYDRHERLRRAGRTRLSQRA